MEAEELMIGDWVVYDGDVEHIDPVKIEGMDIATGMLITSDRDDVGFQGVQPIPLTPEILEKNGFERGEYKDLLAWHNELERVIWIDGGLTKIMSMMTDEHYEGWCYDVHQLQHALKLCRINKNIIV